MYGIEDSFLSAGQHVVLLEPLCLVQDENPSQSRENTISFLPYTSTPV